MKFDFDQALQGLKSGKHLLGQGGILTPLIKQLTEALLTAELEEHILSSEEKNRRNGFNKKTMQCATGTFELSTPRDREGTFEPQLVKKYQTHLTQEIDEKILSLYAFGMSYRDIRAQIKELYGISISESLVNHLSDSLVPELEKWQERKLDKFYPVLWLDAIVYKIKENNVFQNNSIYTILALNQEGKKEVLGLYISQNEGAHYWLEILHDLKDRGLEDLGIVCVDGLPGFPEAIANAYPHAEIQQCIVHQIRNSMRALPASDRKNFLVDLKPIYQAPTKKIAEEALDRLEQIWGKKYPSVIDSWKKKWTHLSLYFKYPEEIRHIIYTTNIIESVHRQFRKLTKTKSGFSNEKSLFKLLYAGIVKISKKWIKPIKNWDRILPQLSSHFPGKFDAICKAKL